MTATRSSKEEVPVADARLQQLHTAPRGKPQYEMLQRTIEDGWPSERKS